jgi:hypothetical protein
LRSIYLLFLLTANLLRADGLIAHIAAGYGWDTTITVVNTTSFSQPTTVWFWDDSGSAMTLNVTGLGPSPGFMFTLPPNGMGIAEVTGPADTVKQGYATVVGKTAVGNAIFTWNTNPNYEASVPISPLVQKIVFPFDNSNGFSMGIALVNTVENFVHVTIRGQDGHIIKQTVAPIVKHQSYQMRDVYPETDGIAGTIEFDALDSDSQPQAVISAIALRFNPSGPFTTLTPVYAGNF